MQTGVAVDVYKRQAWYVVDKDVENNELIVAQGHDHPRLFSEGLIAKQLHWVCLLYTSTSWFKQISNVGEQEQMAKFNKDSVSGTVTVVVLLSLVSVSYTHLTPITLTGNTPVT